jgi:hypothetical protein
MRMSRVMDVERSLLARTSATILHKATVRMTVTSPIIAYLMRIPIAGNVKRVRRRPAKIVVCGPPRATVRMIVTEFASSTSITTAGTVKK